MTRFRALVPLALATLVLTLVALPWRAAVWSAPQDRQIAERQFPVCGPTGEYVSYNTTTGRWVCSSTKPSGVFADLTIGTTAVSETDIAKIDGITNGTTAASKALVTDANGAVSILRTASLRLGASGSETTVARTGAEINLLTQGVAAGYKVARGIATSATASDTVASGLATIVAVVCQFQDAPTVDPLFVACDIGDQAGSPAAGSFLLKTYKPTAVNDVTPVAATTFSKAIAWVAIGT